MGVDFSDFTDAQAVDAIEQCYPLGWSEFRRDFRDAQPVSSGAEVTQRQLIRQLLQSLNTNQHPVGPLDEIDHVKITDSRVELILTKYEVRIHPYRWRVAKKGTAVHTWTRKSTDVQWKHRMMSLWDDDFTPYDLAGQYSNIRTQDRWEDAAEQWHLCYRPGTAKSPMDGPGSLSREGWVECYDKYEKRQWKEEVKG